ncbi:MAG TPA: hypothetical protein VHG52_04270 [Thermomicrobiales bacterium]|nr:hypothetical protein [Thermomicrobiales bacterium]
MHVRNQARFPATTYCYLVVAYERIPEAVINSEQVESDRMLTESGSGCVRAPAGVLFHVHLEDGATGLALTDRRGEFVLEKPDGVGVDVDMPRGVNGNFPSRRGYQPLDVSDHIPANDLACPAGTANVCDRVYVLVP